MLERLNSVNDVKIYSVFDDEFAPYGKVIDGDFSSVIKYLEDNTSIPARGNVYVADVPSMHSLPAAQTIMRSVFGGMPVQFGYCNGKNETLNGFEYHKASELDIFASPAVLALGHVWEIRDGNYKVGDEKLFYIPYGAAVELYGTTLHLSPMRVTDDGFKVAVVLPEGVNTPLCALDRALKEDTLLLQKGKWVIAHTEREPLVKQGAHIGLIGENRRLKY